MQTLNTYNTRQPIDAHVKKRLFWVIPVYVFLKVLMPIIIVFGVYGIWAVLTQDKPTQVIYPIVLTLSFIVAEIVTLKCFFFLSQQKLRTIYQRLSSDIKPMLWPIVIVSCLTLLAYYGGQCIAHHLNQPWGFQHSQSEQYLSGMFTHPHALPFVWVSMVVLRPLVEELIFRHLFIHELAKCIPMVVAMIFSIIADVVAHSYHYHSVLEIGIYSLIPIGAVIIYRWSQQNLLAAYVYHSMTQCIIFLVLSYQSYL